VTGFGGVFAVVLAELVAGGLAVTWCSPLWNEAKRSYFTVYGGLMTVLFALPTWFVARSSAGDAPWAPWTTRLSLLTLALVGGSTLLMTVRRQTAARIAGLASVAASAGVLAALAPSADRPYPMALVQVATGALFLGAVYDALFLGHWYLTDRKLTRVPIQRYAMVVVLACIVEMVVVAATGSSGGAVSGSLNPLLAAGDVAPWIAIGMAGATLLIAVMAKAALRGDRASAVRSATGFYYIGVITAITAEIAVKTRFFPG